jgi:hypothetical protein
LSKRRIWLFFSARKPLFHSLLHRLKVQKGTQMRKPTLIQLLIVTVGVCLLLMMSFGGTVFASSQGTHPQLSGTRYVTSSYGSAVVKIHGSGFLPSTPTTTNTANIFVIASAGSAVQGPYGGFFIPVDSQGSFLAYFGVSGLGSANQWFQMSGIDLTTRFYTNIIFTISDGTTAPAPRPHISGPDHVVSSGGCANVKVHGTDFLPTTDPNAPNSAQVSVFASTDFQANGTIFPTVDSQGSFSAILPVCGLGLAHDLIEIGVEDITTYLYANVIYTTSD